ncbi:MAG: precorrin-6y C5,15-methyltransferase (decarboxylating) subunit CbiE [Anaerolineae bacterium]|nr:precorrin-6y C5,15-methyltransferase (decarboxylating) subunit CbiE [Anaerolineae bacterium]
MPEKVTIIGLGADGAAVLSEQALNLIRKADELWGSRRLLEGWPDFQGKKVVLEKNLPAMLSGLTRRAESARIVILASGDPGFYGVAAPVLRLLPPEEVWVIPAVSCLQTAFARIKVPWSDAVLTSAHARPLAELIGLARRQVKLGILTDPLHSPAFIADRLLAAGLPDCRAVVLENLGSPLEKISDIRLSGLLNRTFDPLNVLLLLQDAAWRPAPLLSLRPDAAYRHKNGLITKSDVRLAAIGRLRLSETDTVWDIGAGSGAVSIEMAEICWRGRVFALEKDEECLQYLRENTSRYGTDNVTVIAGCAPQALAGLPRPAAVFIGGSSGHLEDILECVKQSAGPGCRVVANFTLLENLLAALAWMRAAGWSPELSEACFSVGTLTGAGTRLAPQNPVYILNGTVAEVKKG